MIFFDSSALIKLIAPEPESATLSDWITCRAQQRRAASAVAKVEVMRAFGKIGPAAEALASIIMAKVELLVVGQDVLDAAVAVPGPLDVGAALQLATAYTHSDALHAFVSYHTASLEAAEKLGLPTASPGLEREASLS